MTVCTSSLCHALLPEAPPVSLRPTSRTPAIPDWMQTGCWLSLRCWTVPGPWLVLCTAVAGSFITHCVALWELCLLYQCELVSAKISPATLKKWGTIQKARAGVVKQPVVSWVCSMSEGYENALPSQNLFHAAPCWGPTESRAYSCKH